MEGLLPVIIALVLSAIFSLQKKKAHSEESSSPQSESPWDDLVRELQAREEPSKPSPSSFPPAQPAEPVIPESVPSEQILEEIPVAEPFAGESSPVATEKPSAPSWEQTTVWPKKEVASREINSVIPEPVTSVLDLTHLPFEEGTFRTLTLQEVKAVSDPVAAASKQEEPEEESPLVAGFDPRMAVLYSEILHPKYQD